MVSVPRGTGKGGLNLIAVTGIVLAGLVIAFFSLRGGTTGNTGLFVAGVVFSGAFIMASLINVLLPGFGVLTSDADIYEEALALWAGIVLILLLGVFGGVQFSFLSAPTDAGHVLSSSLATTEEGVQSIINVIVAPFGENFLIIPLAALGLAFAGTASVVGIMAAAIVPALIFIGLHGPRTLLFQLLAGVIMLLWIVLVFGRTVGVDLRGLGSAAAIVSTFLFTVGLHVGINVVGSGGVTQFVEQMLTLSPDIAFAGYAILAYLGGTFVLALIGAGQRLRLL